LYFGSRPTLDELRERAEQEEEERWREREMEGGRCL
jgi:hypothetical protein